MKSIRSRTKLKPLYDTLKCCQVQFNHWYYDSRFLKNVNRADEKKRKRALLVYLTRPFLINPRSKDFLKHQNRWASVELARLLGEFGYIVDVINYDNYQSVVTADYDVLLGFGRAADLAHNMPKQTIKIFLATGSLSELTGQRERKRIEEVNKKRGCNLKSIREITKTSTYLKSFDAIASFGNDVTAETYRPYFAGPIHCFNNHGYKEWSGIPKGKNFEIVRNNFLYLGSGGQILSGLDLVLDVFLQRPNLNLFVCGPFEEEREFVECFQKELYQTKNIIPIGWVTLGSQRHFELMRQCCAIILPVFAGGSPGTVVLCMAHGIIPIISREAGINTDGFGITLQANTVDEIGKAVDLVSNKTNEWHEIMAHKVMEAYLNDYTQSAFTRRFREILQFEITRRKLI